MAVTAHDNGFGSHEVFEPFYLAHDQYYSNGEHYRQIVEERPSTKYAERYGPSNNPLIPLVEAGEPCWRHPSLYSRHIYEHDYTQGVYIVNKWSGGFFTEQHIASRPLGSDQWTESRYSMGGGGPPWPDDLYSRSVAEGLLRIKNGLADLGEDLAQMSQTYGMLVDAIHVLGTALNAVRRRDIGAARRLIGDARGVIRHGGDFWLQYQYGWKPLVNEVWNAANELWQPKPRVPLMHLRQSIPTTMTYLLSSPNLDSTGVVKISGKTRFNWKLTNSFLGTTMDRIGLSNPLTLGWNLIPYTFVVDWMIPIGSILDSFTPPQGTEFVGGSSTVTWTGAGEYTLLGLPNWETIEPAHTYFKCFSMERRIHNEWPIAGLYVKSPFSLSHGITSVALYLQSLRNG